MEAINCFLHPMHSRQKSVGSVDTEPVPLTDDVASQPVATTLSGRAAAQRALQIVDNQPINPRECWTVTLREAAFGGVMPPSSASNVRHRNAAHFFVGHNAEAKFQAVLAIPLFFCSLVYRLPPSGLAFTEADSSTWPAFAVSVPWSRVAIPFFDREARVNDRPVKLAPNGSSFVMYAPCTSAAFLEFVSALSIVGVVRYDIRRVCELTDATLGTGSCSRVMLAKHVNDDQLFYAVKIWHDAMRSEAIHEDARDVALASEAAIAFAHEVALTLAAGRHPNVIRCHGIFLTGADRHLSMLMDCHALGDLKDYINVYGTFAVWDSFVKFGGLLSGVIVIHGVGIVHRDIKPENILVSASGCLVVADFGAACFVDDVEAMKARCGSPGHVAPEVLAGSTYDCKVDVFGAGVVLYYMLTRILPFVSESTKGTLKKNLRAQVRLTHPVLKRLGQNALIFLVDMLEPCPHTRPDSRVAWETCVALPENHCDEERRSTFFAEEDAGLDRSAYSNRNAEQAFWPADAKETARPCDKTPGRRYHPACATGEPLTTVPIAQGSIAAWSRQSRLGEPQQDVFANMQNVHTRTANIHGDTSSRGLDVLEENTDAAAQQDVPALSSQRTEESNSACIRRSPQRRHTAG